MIRGGNIGAMDIYLTIETPTKSYSATTNEETITGWTTFGTAWAERVKNPKSVESFEGDQQVAKLTNFFRIRYLSGVTEEMRVTRGDTCEVTYIKGIEEIDRQKFLVLQTEKRDNG